MTLRNHSFSIDEYYHCYNRGTDKRIIFNDDQDYSYFEKSLEAYNSTKILGKLRLHQESDVSEKIVEVISYCLLPNHFHIILRETKENGISDFLKRVSVGYTMYFNKKNKRSGALFQGTFKSKYIATDQDLRQLFAYVTYNYRMHGITDPLHYRSKINQTLPIVRGYTSNNKEIQNFLEIIDIIKEKRLSYDE